LSAPARPIGPQPERAPGWLAPLVLIVALLLFAGRAWVAIDTDLVADEGYYTLWSLYPGPGYLDHPPAIAWAIALGRWLIGENSLGVRAAALLSPLLISAALYRTGSILFSAAIAGLAVLWYNLSLGVSLSLLATPDVPSTLFWMLALWAVAEFIRSRNPNWWLLVGVFAGLGVLGKYTNLFLGIGLVLFLLSSRERRQWLGLWQLWAGGLLALLVLLPNIWWNIEHDWAGLLFQGRRVTALFASDLVRNYGDLIGGQALFLGPVTLLFALGGMVVWLLRPHHADHAALALPVLSGLPPLLYFVFHASHSHVEANWLLPLWPMLALIAAWVALRGIPAIPGFWHAGRLALYLQTLFGLFVVGFLQWVVVAHPPQFAHLDRTRDMRGWSELRAQLDDIAAREGAYWLGAVNNYGVTGLLSSYGHFAGSDLPVLGIGDSYRYGFLPPLAPQALEFPALVVVWNESGAAQLTPLFGEVTDLGTAERRFGSEVVASYQVFEVAEPTPQFFSAVAR
jgi:4-amino-4-deoxy-L-arabinose transferase-like glycosyltransferase